MLGVWYVLNIFPEFSQQKIANPPNISLICSFVVLRLFNFCCLSFCVSLPNYLEWLMTERE